MGTKLTDDEVQTYMLNQNECPRCESQEMTCGRFEADGDTAWRDVTCDGCGAEWRDVYTFAFVEEVTRGV